MPTEDELRRQLHDDEPHGAIDLNAVLRRSRARRRPRVAAAAIVSSLVVLGIVVPVSLSLASSHTTTTSLSAGSAASAPDSSNAPEALHGGPQTGSGGVRVAPAGRINLCTDTLATLAPAEDGLVLTVQPVDAASDARDIPVTVTLTNTGAQQVSGHLSPLPTLALSRDGVVLWHSNGAVPSLAQQIDLAPGASTTFSTSFDPVVCGVADDAQPSFRTDLPAAGPGDYQLSAAVDFTPSSSDGAGGGGGLLVSGPTSPVTLH